MGGRRIRRRGLRARAWAASLGPVRGGPIWAVLYPRARRIPVGLIEPASVLSLQDRPGPCPRSVESQTPTIVRPYLTAAKAAVYLRRTVQAIDALVKRERLRPMLGSPRRLLFALETAASGSVWDRRNTRCGPTGSAGVAGEFGGPPRPPFSAVRRIAFFVSRFRPVGR